MNMIGQEDYKTQYARLFLLARVWFAEYHLWQNLPFKYHKVLSGTLDNLTSAFVAAVEGCRI